MKRSAVPLLALAAALALSSCTGSSSDTASSSAGAGADSAGGGAAAPAAAPGGKAAASPVSVAAARGRQVLRTGSLDVAVADVPRAADEAGRLVRAAGGGVDADERSSGREDGAGSADLRLRVPPAAFDGLLSRLAALGEERGRSLGSTDVTDQVVDLGARLATQRASVDRVRALLDRATTLGQVVQVEAELTRRTADLESLEARLDALSAEVAQSTLTLRLTPTGERATAAGPRGFDDGLRGGSDALVATARAAALVVGALLPFSPLLLLVAGAAWWRARRGRTVAPHPS